MAVSTNFLRRWNVLNKCPDLGNHQIRKFAIRDDNGNAGASAWLVNDQGRLLAFGGNDGGILGLGHFDPIKDGLVKVEGLSEKTVVDMAFGNDFVAALTGDAQVWTWGKTFYNCVLGDVNREEYFLPRFLCNDIASIKCGDDHGLALSKSGQIWAWGSNQRGQIGNGSNASSCLLVSLASLHGHIVTKIACGSCHSMALTRDGKLFAWGSNEYGELGIVGSNQQSTPVQVDSLPQDSPIKEIACGSYHSLVLLENGQIYAMGNNGDGQLGCPSDIDDTKRSGPVKVKSDIKFESIFCYATFSAAQAVDGRFYVCGYGWVKEGKNHELVRTSYFSASEALLLYYSSGDTPRNMLVDNIETVNPVLAKLATLFNDPKTSDIEFLVEDQSIHAHRHYLPLLSTYMATMLSEHWEADKKQVKIDQFSYPIFLAYIRYLYIGLVRVESMTIAELIDLLDLATSFVEESLQRECIKGLQGKLCIEHACTIFQAADQYELDELKIPAAKFIRNNLDAVVATEDYDKMSFETSKKLLTSMANRP